MLIAVLGTSHACNKDSAIIHLKLHFIENLWLRSPSKGFGIANKGEQNEWHLGSFWQVIFD